MRNARAEICDPIYNKKPTKGEKQTMIVSSTSETNTGWGFVGLGEGRGEGVRGLGGRESWGG